MKLSSFVIPSLTALPALFSQKIPVNFDNAERAVEFNSEAVFVCSWDLEAIDGVNIPEKPDFTVSWSHDNDKIVSINNDGEQRPVFNKRFNDLAYTVSVSNNTSTFKLNSVKLQDEGSFSCDVELKDMVTRTSDDKVGVLRGEISKSFSVYNNPSLTLEAKGEIDMRSKTEKVQSIAVCSVSDAYPKPTQFVASIDGIEIASASEFQVSEQANGLFTASWEINVEIDGKSMNGKNLSCSAVADNWDENEKKTELSILYLPTEVRVEFNNNDNIYEFDNVTVSCYADGNPVLDSTLRSNQTEENTIVSVTRDNSNEYICRVEDSDFDFEIESEPTKVDVFYLDTPVLTSSSGKSSIQLNSERDETLTCGVDSNPEAKITWKRDSNPLASASTKFNVNGKDSNHDGSYSCEASIPGRDAIKSNSIEIDIQEECKIDQPTLRIQKNGDDFVTTFNCKLSNPDAQPKCSVQWIVTADVDPKSIRGKETDTMKITNFVNTENTYIACRASNILGDTEMPVKNNELAKHSADQGMSGLVKAVVVALIVLIVVLGCFVYRKKKSSDEPQEAKQGQSV